MADESFIERVAASATTIAPSKALFTLLALPFYLVGLLAGVVWVAFTFAYGAVKVGIADVRKRAIARRT